MMRTLLKILQDYLKGELRTAKRRKKSGPILIAVLTIGVIAVTQFLDEPDAPTPKKGEVLSCEVRKVYDGDTATASCEKGIVKVRIWGIDAPEMKQKPWGEKSRDQMRQLINGKKVRVEVVAVDRYSRAVGRIYAGDQDAGLMLVGMGGAAVYAQYNKSKTYTPLYQQAQTQAKHKKLGIWSRSGAQQEPWAWRKLNPQG